MRDGAEKRHAVGLQIQRRGGRDASGDHEKGDGAVLQPDLPGEKNRERRHPEDREEALLGSIAAETAGTAESRSLARRMVDRLFAGTAESTAHIAVLHYVDRVTLEEVAAEVGLSVSGVRKRLATLKTRLPIEEAA